jgi:Uma2 family endonuclease
MIGEPAIDGQKKYTYADYVTWPEAERWELLAGIPYNMTPAPSTRHQRVQGELFRQIANFLTDKPCEVFSAPFDVRLPRQDEADEEIENIVQPDIAVICDSSKIDDKGCRGAPDWIIEVISPASSRRDRMVKFYTYERFGVREYWLVTPDDKTIEVFSLGNENTYSRPVFYTEEDAIHSKVLAGLVIDLSDLFPAA